MYRYATVAPGQADGIEQHAQHIAQHVHEQGIHAEGFEEHAPLLAALHVDNPDEQCQQARPEAAGGKHEGGRPYLLVDGAAVAQQQSGKGEDDAYQEQGDELLVVPPFGGHIAGGLGLAAQHHACHAEAYQHVGDGGDGAQDAFGLDAVVAVHVCRGQDGAVYLGQDVLLAIHEAVAQGQQHEVTHQQGHDEPGDAAVLHGQRHEGGGAVAQGQALHDAQDADVVERPHRLAQLRPEAYALGGRRPVEAEAAEPAQPQADEEDDRRAADNLQGGGAAEGEVVLLQRDVGGNAHDEHEEREHQVGGRQSVPLGMAQGRVDVPPAAGIVYHCHAGNGDASQDVDGEDAFAACSGLDTVHGDDVC